MSMAITRALLFLTAVVALASSTAAYTVPAFHFSVVRSAPAADQVLTVSPERLQYWFSQAPAEGVSEIKLLRGTVEVAVTRTTIVAGEKAMFASPAKPLEPGVYKMTWRAAGDDGHAMKGETTFTVASPKP